MFVVVVGGEQHAARSSARRKPDRLNLPIFRQSSARCLSGPANRAVVVSPDSSEARSTWTFVVSIHTVFVVDEEEDAASARAVARRAGRLGTRSFAERADSSIASARGGSVQATHAARLARSPTPSRRRTWPSRARAARREGFAVEENARAETLSSVSRDEESLRGMATKTRRRLARSPDRILRFEGCQLFLKKSAEIWRAITTRRGDVETRASRCCDGGSRHLPHAMAGYATRTRRNADAAQKAPPKVFAREDADGVRREKKRRADRWDAPAVPGEASANGRALSRRRGGRRRRRGKRRSRGCWRRSWARGYRAREHGCYSRRRTRADRTEPPRRRRPRPRSRRPRTPEASSRSRGRATGARSWTTLRSTSRPSGAHLCFPAGRWNAVRTPDKNAVPLPDRPAGREVPLSLGSAPGTTGSWKTRRRRKVSPGKGSRRKTKTSPGASGPAKETRARGARGARTEYAYNRRAGSPTPTNGFPRNRRKRRRRRRRRRRRTSA